MVLNTFVSQPEVTGFTIFDSEEGGIGTHSFYFESISEEVLIV